MDNGVEATSGHPRAMQGVITLRMQKGGATRAPQQTEGFQVAPRSDGTGLGKSGCRAVNPYVTRWLKRPGTGLFLQTSPREQANQESHQPYQPAR